MRDNNLTGKGRMGAIILAGGDSKRLGQPKAILDFFGRPMIKVIADRLGGIFQEITIVTDRPELYKDIPARIIGDLLAGQAKSPLRGIHAGLKASDLPYQFVAACDMPMLNLDLIRYMADFAPHHDAVVPLIENYYQPLHSFYSRDCIAVIEKQVKEGLYKITDFYAHLKIRFIGANEILRFDPNQESFVNINTWADYEKALDMFLARGKQ